MLMQELDLKNKDLIERLNNLSQSVEKVILGNEDAFIEAVKEKLYSRSHHGRRADGKDDVHVSAPHHDILPDFMDELNYNNNYYNPCGKDYLDYMMKLERGEIENIHHESATSGWPNKEPFLGLDDLNHNKVFAPLMKEHNVWEAARSISFDFLGGNAMALFAIYPPGGFIPWHHNGNAPGYNILAHYSWGGDGYFCTWDEGEIVYYNDLDKEWVVRVGRYLDTVGTYDSRINRSRGTDIPFATTEDASWHAAETKCFRLTISTILNIEDVWLDLIDEIESE